MIKYFFYSLIILLNFTQVTHAHPHAWIDLKSTVLFDDSGKISGLRITWLFGDFYTAYAVEGMDKDGDGLPDQILLDKLAEENLKNLAVYNYFLDFEENGKAQTTLPVDEFSTRMNGNRLRLEFFVPLTVPVDPRENNVSYSIYDPTYYVEILYTGESPITLEGDGAEFCQNTLASAEPSNEVRLFASSLDATESGGNSIGKAFAEVVKISCN